MNRSQIIILVAVGAALTLLLTIRSIYPGVAGAQTPTTAEAVQNSQLARRVAGEIYYDISFSTDRISRGKEKWFNITITAINVQTGLVDKNPFQRVQLTSLPIETAKAGSRVQWTPPGTFTSNSSSKPSIYAEYTSVYPNVATPAEMWPVSNFDLIEGTAEVRFSATNTPKTDDYIGFMVTPASWSAPLGNNNERIAQAHRFSLQTPRKPASYSNFLYKEWRTDDEMADHIFTLATLPVGDAVVQTMIELGNWEPKNNSTIDQPQNNSAQNAVVPPAANLTQPIYDETASASSRLALWLWLVGSLIILAIGGLWWLARKGRRQK